MVNYGLGRGRMLRYRLLVLTITFFTYASFHMSRKAPSIVKGALHPHVESSKTTQDWNPQTNPGWLPFSADLNPAKVSASGYTIDLSEVCEVNTHQGAGVYTCVTHKVATNYYNMTYCSHYLSKSKKFSLREIDEDANPHNIGLCAKHGAPNGTLGCWIINGNVRMMTPNEKVYLCRYTTGEDCTMYVQPQGHLIPAPADDKIGWVDINDGDFDNETRTGIDVAPAGLTNGKVLLGSLDTVYLIFYAMGLFVSGHLADHMSLRLFLTIGMTGSAIFVAMIGAAAAFDIHNIWYFYTCYAIQGLFQSTGWPAVVAVMGNWFPKSTRGLVMGIWNAHTSVGNIIGSLLSGAALGMNPTVWHGNNWPMAFYLSGSLIGAMGLAVFCFLPNKPEDVGLPSLKEEEESLHALLLSQASGSYGSQGWDKAQIAAPDNKAMTTTHPFVNNNTNYNRGQLDDPIQMGNNTVDTPGNNENDTSTTVVRKGCHRYSFCRALSIPGVLEFAMALFFAKFVAYMFIYWLPYYLGHLKFSTEEAANISSYFDLGGIIGGVIAGWSSDRLGRRAPVAFFYLICSIPALFFYRQISASVGDSSLGINILIMLVCGAFVNGPYALITTAVSADLGTHPSLKGDQTLTATVTGIIDGTGSVGASVQGVLIGLVASGCTATGQSWDAVFNLLMICCAMSGICLARLVWKQGPTDVYSCGSTVYRIVVVVLMLGMVGVLLYCANELMKSCAGSEPCRQY